MDDGATDGNFIARNGQLWSGGTDDQDADYIQLYMNLKF